MHIVYYKLEILKNQNLVLSDESSPLEEGTQIRNDSHERRNWKRGELKNKGWASIIKLVKITMNNSSKTSIKQIEKCIKHLPGVEFKAEDRYQAYKWNI